LKSLSIASFMLANTERLIIGSSIANIYARDPFTGTPEWHYIRPAVDVGVAVPS
jgi:hypothetical protein